MMMCPSPHLLAMIDISRSSAAVVLKQMSRSEISQWKQRLSPHRCVIDCSRYGETYKPCVIIHWLQRRNERPYPGKKAADYCSGDCLPIPTVGVFVLAGVQIQICQC